jgi:hypothetical protein
MSDGPRKTSLRPWGLVGPCVLLALYVSGYFMLGKFSMSHGYIFREYRSEVVALAYEPLGILESMTRRTRVVVLSE